MTTALEKATVYADEARVASWNENDKGIFVRFELQPSDTHPFKHEQGQRFAIVCTRIGNDEKPDANKPEAFDHKAAYQARDEGAQAVTRAVLLCKEPAFQEWVNRDNEIDAALVLTALCQIESRSEIAKDPDALKKFLAIEQEYKEATGQATERRT